MDKLVDTQHEKGLIGSILLDAIKVLPDLEAANGDVSEWFQDLACRDAYQAIRSLYDRKHPVDVLTVSRDAEGVDIGYLIECCECAPTALNWGYHAEALDDIHRRRQLYLSCQQTQAAALNRDLPIKELVDQHAGDVSKLNIQAASEAIPLKDALKRALDVFEEAIVHKGSLRGVPSGLPTFDRCTRGFKPGQLIVIAARPGQGKTSLAMNMAIHAAQRGLPTGVFSLEMDPEELASRLLCSFARVSIPDIENGLIDQEEQKRLTVACSRLAKAPLYVDDKAGLSISQLAARARRMKHKHDIRVFFVDYLQLLKGSNPKASRYESITEVSNGLKVMARDLATPVVALAQISRATERENREPYLSDLRDSGAIEQDADLVAFLHRPDPDTDISNLIIRKHRSGPEKTIPLVFDRSTTSFTEHELP